MQIYQNKRRRQDIRREKAGGAATAEVFDEVECLLFECFV